MKNLFYLLLSLLICSSFSLAEDPMAGQPKKLNQVDQEIMNQMKDRQLVMKQDMEAVSKERDKLRQLLRNPKSSDQEIRDQSNLVNLKMQEVSQKRTEDIINMRKKLTPQQFQKMLDRFDQNREQMIKKQ